MPKTPVATSKAANRLRFDIMTTLLLLTGIVCAALAWWLAQGVDPDAAPSALVALLVLLPVAVAITLLMRVVRTLERAGAALAQHQALAQVQHQALEQTLLVARRERDLLVTALDNLPVGVAVFDRRNQLSLSNRFLNRLIPGLSHEMDARSGHQELLRRERELGVQPYATQEPTAMDDDTGATRASLHHAALLQYPGDRWVQALVAHSEHGAIVVARADVTELVRAHHQATKTNEQLVRQSATDSLTGITNRRRFDETLGVEWLRAARAGTCLSLLVVDIDHFKRFNDHYGHVAGDECLRQVAGLLQACVRRAGELVARYGGEEFVILLPAAGLSQAEELAQRCLDGIAQLALPHAASPTAPHVTFSIGIAQLVPSAMRDPASLVNAADTAMYRVKSAGRARYEVADLADWEIDKDAPRSRPGELN